MRIIVYCAPRRLLTSWLAFGLLMLLSLAATADDLNAPKRGAAADAPAVTMPAIPADKPKQCYNGCQSWGQMCNVDPRGVYKCQRRCEKFGEICE